MQFISATNLPADKLANTKESRGKNAYQMKGKKAKLLKSLHKFALSAVLPQIKNCSQLVAFEKRERASAPRSRSAETKKIDAKKKKKKPAAEEEVYKKNLMKLSSDYATRSRSLPPRTIPKGRERESISPMRSPRAHAKVFSETSDLNYKNVEKKRARPRGV